jgi:hypothetical protein
MAGITPMRDGCLIFYARFWPMFEGCVTPIYLILQAALLAGLLTSLLTAAGKRTTAGWGRSLSLALALGLAALAAGPLTARGLIRLLDWTRLLWLFLPLAVLAIYVSVIRAWLREGALAGPAPRPASAIAAVVGLALFLFVFAGLTAMMRGGLDAIERPFLRTDLEFTGDLSQFTSLYDIFHNYVARHPQLSLHGRAYPPGPVALLHLAAMWAGPRALNLSLFTMAMGASAVLPLYGWVRDLTDERTARLACALYSVMPPPCSLRPPVRMRCSCPSFF